MWEPWNTLNHLTSTPPFSLTLEARLSFFMACIIPRRPWQPDASLLDGPAAGELSWDATSELGMMLMLSGVEALSSMVGSAPFRQLKVFRLLWGGGGFNSVEGAKKKGSRTTKACGWTNALAQWRKIWLTNIYKNFLRINAQFWFCLKSVRCKAEECDVSVITTTPSDFVTRKLLQIFPRTATRGKTMSVFVLTRLLTFCKDEDVWKRLNVRMSHSHISLFGVPKDKVEKL